MPTELPKDYQPPGDNTPRTQEDIDHAEWENTANWRLGIFYHSTRDSRSWVPKRSMFGRRRFGGTPNFAKPSARKHMMIIVGIVIVIVMWVVVIERVKQLP